MKMQIGNEDLLRELEELQRASELDEAQAARASELVELVVSRTAEAYSAQSGPYRALRREEPDPFDVPMNNRLIDECRARFPERGSIRLLDVGAGYGRDIRFFDSLGGFDLYALEVCDDFVQALRELSAEGVLPLDHVISADMRNLAGLADASFDCVRNHASLHHLPVICRGVGADEAVAETARILRPGGIFYATVKHGTTIEMTDTSEGLGARFFQYFDSDTLVGLLHRNEFDVIYLEQRTENRPSGAVEWIFTLATRK